jgi:hypothetical protein
MGQRRQGVSATRSLVAVVQRVQVMASMANSFFPSSSQRIPLEFTFAEIIAWLGPTNIVFDNSWMLQRFASVVDIGSCCSVPPELSGDALLICNQLLGNRHLRQSRR